MRSRGRPGMAATVVWVQSMLLALSSVLLVAPPTAGSIAIMPAIPGDSAATLDWAIAAGALPVALGPYRGSIVVQGTLRGLLLPALSHGALLIAAPRTDCGSAPAKEPA